MWPRMRRDPRIADELRFHRERLIEDHVARGMSRADAERLVFLEFGNPPQIEEAVRDARGRWLDDLSKDVQYACRTFRRAPGFFAIAVLSLALGIGANSAIFSLINAVMLRPLSVSEPSRLVQLGRVLEGNRPRFVPYPVFEHLRDHLSTVQSLFAQTTSSQSVVIDGDDDFVTVDAVSGSYFAVLRIQPAAGRLLGPADDVENGSSAVVITDGYWQRRFGRSPSAIGASVTMRNGVFTIVGVTPPGFRGAQSARSVDLLVPLAAMMTRDQRASLGWNSLALLGRLADGATVDQASAETEARFSAFMRAKADAARLSEKQRAEVLRPRGMARLAPGGLNPIRDDLRQPLMLLMGIVVLILILACVNLSGLLLARAEARQREVSIRLAIGAGRGRLLRQFLTESVLLAAFGGALGLAMSIWLSRSLFSLFVAGRDVDLSVAPDWRVLTFVCGVSLAACVFVGLVPALRAVHSQPNPALKEVRARGQARLGRLLVMAQCAISMILIVGSTLFVGTLVKLYAVDLGFNSNQLAVVNVRSARPYPAARALAVQRALLDRLRVLPGVRSASAAQALPVGGGLWDRGVQVEGYAPRPDEPNVAFNVIAPGYFATLETPLVAGREFTDRDSAAAPKVAIVNQSFARYFFGDAPAIGRHVTSAGVTYDIVGIVGDAKYQDLREEMLRTLYVAWTQYEGAQPSSYAYIVRVIEGDPLRATAGLDRLVRDVDPALRVRTADSYDMVVNRSIAVERTMATLGGLFGLLALVVAALGMFGLLSFQVARRTNELGIRMVLGASRGSMISLIMKDVAVLLIGGVVIGTGAALTLTGVTQKLLFGLAPNEPAVFVIAASALALAAIVAAWLPARRASGLDPFAALRHE